VVCKWQQIPEFVIRFFNLLKCRLRLYRAYAGVDAEHRPRDDELIFEYVDLFEFPTQEARPFDHQLVQFILQVCLGRHAAHPAKNLEASGCLVFRLTLRVSSISSASIASIWASCGPQTPGTGQRGRDLCEPPPTPVLGLRS
jgi:hypothetical protein